jgi:threonine/homoserine/homoserine lactone efflux protein
MKVGHQHGAALAMGVTFGSFLWALIAVFHFMIGSRSERVKTHNP